MIGNKIFRNCFLTDRNTKGGILKINNKYRISMSLSKLLDKSKLNLQKSVALIKCNNRKSYQLTGFCRLIN